MFKVWMEGRSAAFTAGVPLVVIVVAITATMTGLFMYRRSNTQTAAQPDPTHSAGLIWIKALSLSSFWCNEVLSCLCFLLFIRYSHRVSWWLWKCRVWGWAQRFSFTTSFTPTCCDLFCFICHFSESTTFYLYLTDPLSQQADSLYDEFDDENLCTCKRFRSYEIVTTLIKFSSY